MLNLIKAEWYQLTQRRATRGWFIAAVVLTLLLVIIPSVTSYFSDFPDFQTAVKIQMFYEAVTSSATFLLLALVNVAFNNELKNRTLINSISYGYSRKQIYLAKLIGSAIMSICFLVLSVVTFCLVTPLVSDGSPLTILANLTSLADYLPIWFAFLGCYVWISFLSETNTPSYITIALLFIVFPLVFQLANAFNIQWIQAIEPYFITRLNPHSPIILFGLNAVPLISLSYLIGFTLIGMRHFDKKEI